MKVKLLPFSALRSKASLCAERYLGIGEGYRLSVCIYRRGELYLLGGDSDATRLQYDIGSVSKTMCAHLILYLAEEGLLDLDESVDRYLPLKKGRYPSVRSLLTHTAGYGHLTPWEITLPSLIKHGYARKNVYERCSAETVTACLQRRRWRKPCGGYGYSDFAFAVLATVAEAVTGKGFADLFENFVQNVLGLKDTVIHADPAVRQPKAVQGKRVLPFWYWSRQNPYIAGGGLVTTPRDMLKYIKLQIESPLPFIAKAHELAEQSLSKKSNTAMCLGWHTYKRSDQLWHVGGVSTFRTSVIVNKRTRFGVAVLGNAKGVASANVHYLAKMLYSENKIRKIDYGKAYSDIEI